MHGRELSKSTGCPTYDSQPNHEPLPVTARSPKSLEWLVPVWRQIQVWRITAAELELNSNRAGIQTTSIVNRAAKPVSTPQPTAIMTRIHVLIFLLACLLSLAAAGTLPSPLSHP